MGNDKRGFWSRRSKTSSTERGREPVSVCLRTGIHLSKPDVHQNILPLRSNRTYSTAQHQSQSGESPGDPASDEEKKVLMRMQRLSKPQMILKEGLAKAMQKKEAKKKKKEVRLTRRKMRISKRAKRMETRRTIW